MDKLTPRMKQRIKKKFMMEKPTVHVGKKQISRELIGEIKKQLDNREVVKVKILKSALEDTTAEELASAIAKETDAEMVEVRGHTFLLYKHKQKQIKK